MVSYKVRVTRTTQRRPDRDCLYAGILRGLANGLSGYPAIGGLTNHRFLTKGRLDFRFAEHRKARTFACMGRVATAQNLVFTAFICR